MKTIEGNYYTEGIRQHYFEFDVPTNLPDFKIDELVRNKIFSIEIDEYKWGVSGNE